MLIILKSADTIIAIILVCLTLMNRSTLFDKIHQTLDISAFVLYKKSPTPKFDVGVFYYSSIFSSISLSAISSSTTSSFGVLAKVTTLAPSDTRITRTPPA